MGCVPERLHLFPREEGCRGRHGEADPELLLLLLLLLLLRRAPAPSWGSAVRTPNVSNINDMELHELSSNTRYMKIYTTLVNNHKP